jgi:hypothetical protein
MGLMSDNYDSYGNMGGMDDEPYRPGLMQSAKNWMSQDKNKHALMQMVQAIGQPINGTRGASSSQNTLGIISNMLGAYNQSNMGGYDQYKQQQEMQKLKTDDLRSQVDLRKANLAQMNAPAAPKSALDYISKLDPANYTPESFAAFGQSMNPADLRARSKVDIAPSGEVYDPYNQSALGKNMGALKDFDMGQTRLFTRPDGTPVANLPMSQSPNSVASNANSMRIAGMTDARAREFNAITRQGNGVQAETGLRKEFADLPEVKNYKAAFPAFDAIRSAAQRNTPQSDINLVYGIAKLYDPTSVVREGEYSTVANSPAIPERVKGYIQYIAGGGKLSPETKKQIMAEAEARIGSYEQQYQGAQQAYGQIAEKRGALSENIFTPVGRIDQKGRRATDSASNIDDLIKKYAK